MHELQFRRMIGVFLQKLLCYYHGDYSLWAFPPFSANPPLTKNGDSSHFNVLTLGNFPGHASWFPQLTFLITLLRGKLTSVVFHNHWSRTICVLSLFFVLLRLVVHMHTTHWVSQLFVNRKFPVFGWEYLMFTLTLTLCFSLLTKLCVNT